MLHVPLRPKRTREWSIGFYARLMVDYLWNQYISWEFQVIRRWKFGWKKILTVRSKIVFAFFLTREWKGSLSRGLLYEDDVGFSRLVNFLRACLALGGFFSRGFLVFSGNDRCQRITGRINEDRLWSLGHLLQWYDWLRGGRSLYGDIVGHVFHLSG